MDGGGHLDTQTGSVLSNMIHKNCCSDSSVVRGIKIVKETIIIWFMIKSHDSRLRIWRLGPILMHTDLGWNRWRMAAAQKKENHNLWPDGGPRRAAGQLVKRDSRHTSISPPSPHS